MKNRSRNQNRSCTVPTDGFVTFGSLIWMSGLILMGILSLLGIS